MKILNILCLASLVTLLQAEATYIEKYTDSRNSDYIRKIEKQREKMLEARNNAQKIRNFEDSLREHKQEALYARIEKSYTPYR